MDIIKELTQVLRSRQSAEPDSSYVASLYGQGLNKILEKVGEEATEVILAAKDHTQTDINNDLVNEVADLWFHTLILLVHLEQDPQQVLATLEARFGTSGHDEKAARAK